jgi:hypothetical protein
LRSGKQRIVVAVAGGYERVYTPIEVKPSRSCGWRHGALNLFMREVTRFCAWHLGLRVQRRSGQKKAATTHVLRRKATFCGCGSKAYRSLRCERQKTMPPILTRLGSGRRSTSTKPKERNVVAPTLVLPHLG